LFEESKVFVCPRLNGTDNIALFSIHTLHHNTSNILWKSIGRTVWVAKILFTSIPSTLTFIFSVFWNSSSNLSVFSHTNLADEVQTFLTISSIDKIG